MKPNTQTKHNTHKTIQYLPPIAYTPQRYIDMKLYNHTHIELSQFSFTEKKVVNINKH